MPKQTFNTLVLILLYLMAKATFAQWSDIDITSFINTHKLSEHEITVPKDPVYQAEKHYLAYSVQPLITQLALTYPQDLSAAVLVFTAVDGYKVAMAYSDIDSEPGFLAFHDQDAKKGDWESFVFGTEKMTPAPYYLVWTTAGIDKWRYPWPFQLKSISLQPAAVYYGHAAPIDKSDNIKQGFNTFSRYCIRCHAINASGGKVGPELNTPYNVSEFYADEFLANMITNAPQYFKGTKMPAFQDILTDHQVSNIIDYLKSMKQHKINAGD